MTRAQLLDAGVTLAEISHRVGTGALLREHRGVYRVGHRAPSVEARYLAAVLVDLAAVLGIDALARACHEAGVLHGTTPADVDAALIARPTAKGTSKLRRIVHGDVDYHSSRHAWEQDRRREREAYARGDEVRRYTWGDVFEDPEAMLSELRVLLSARTPA